MFRSLVRCRPTKFQKSLRNLQMTFACGMITILVLRGTIGGVSFGTPQQDIKSVRKLLAVKSSNSGRALSKISFKEELQLKGDGNEFVVAPHPLGQRIGDWDSQRSTSTESKSKSAAAQILLVTGSQPEACENPSGDHFLLRSLKNKVDYSRLHNMQIYHSMASFDSELTGFWAKLPLLRRLLLSHPTVEWIWWMDSDAIITDMSFDLSTMVEKYGDANLVLHGWPSEVYERRNWLGLNTGSFLIRNCQWSLDLLDAWAPMGPKGAVRMAAGAFLSRNLPGRPDFEADDQSALVYLLASEKEKWGDKVFLENSFALHGYWKMIVDEYERLAAAGKNDWPFVTHFVGCKPCGNHGHYPAQECSLGMERALNFADDQVLEPYGFHHSDFNSRDVAKM